MRKEHALPPQKVFRCALHAMSCVLCIQSFEMTRLMRCYPADALL